MLGCALLSSLTAACAPSPEESPPSEPIGEVSEPLVSPGWEKLPYAGGAFSLSGAVAITANAGVHATRSRAWGRVGTSIKTIERNEGSGWDASWATPGSLPSGVTSTGGVGALLRNDGATNLAFRGTDTVFYQTYSSGGTLYPFASTGGQGYGDPGWSQSGNNVHLWVRGLNNGLWLYRYAGGWEAWRNLGAPSGITLASGPSAVRIPGTSTVKVAVLGSDGKTWLALWDDTAATLGSWSSVTAPSGSMLGAPAISAAVVGSSGVSNLFVNASNKLYRASFLWDGEPSYDGSLVSLSSAAFSPTAAYLGRTSDKGTHLAVVGTDGYAYWRRWYDQTPVATVYNTSPRAPRITHVKADLTTLGPYGCEDQQFENTGTLVHAGQAGCAEDTVVIGGGVGFPGAGVAGVAPGSLGCFLGSGSGSGGACAWGAGGGVGAGSVPRCAATMADTMRATGAAFNFPGTDAMVALVGRHPATPRLYHVRQMNTSGAYPGAGGAPASRGASVVFESSNCAQGLSVRTSVDCCDAAMGCFGRCTDGGTDRPMIAATTTTSGNLYMQANTNGFGVFRMNATAASPAMARVSYTEGLLDVGVHAPSCGNPSRPVAVGGKVLFACLDGDFARVFQYEEATSEYLPSLAAQAKVSGNDVVKDWTPYSVWALGAPIGVQGPDVYARFAYPIKLGATGSERQAYRLLVVRFAGGLPTVVASSLVQASTPTGSVLWPSFLTPNESDLRGRDATLGMLVWYESSTSSQTTGGESGQGWGNVSFRGCALRDISADCAPITLSKHGGSDRSWPYALYHRGSIQQIGDYQESGGFWNAPTGTFRFLAHYNEATPDADVQRVAIVEISP